MELLQPTWRGRGLNTRRDGNGNKYVALKGTRALLYTPITALPDSKYRITVEMRKEGGNGKSYCNIYGNRKFDFPHSPLLCDGDGWRMYTINIETKKFPQTLPLVFRIWRASDGTGSILIRKIKITLIESSAEVGKQQLLSVNNVPLRKAPPPVENKPKVSKAAQRRHAREQRRAQKNKERAARKVRAQNDKVKNFITINGLRATNFSNGVSGPPISVNDNHIMCISKKFTKQLRVTRPDGIEFLGYPSANFELLFKTINDFKPKWLHIILDDDTYWRSFLPAIRCSMPDMSISICSYIEEFDNKLASMHAVVDHIVLLNNSNVEKYHNSSIRNVICHPCPENINFVDHICSLAKTINKQLESKSSIDISICIGTFNRLESLKKSVKSVIASAEDKSFEIIINDAGSTDGTKEWLLNPSQAKNNVITIFSGKKTSFTQAFNESLQIARGKFVCWLSDDIVACSTAIKDMCNVMEKLALKDMGGFAIRDPGSPYKVRTDQGYFSPTVGCMYTETLRKYGGFNSDYPYYSQDTELCLRVLRLGGAIVECPVIRLDHNCLSDALRVDNNRKHVSMLGEGKFQLVDNSLRVLSYWPFPSILLNVSTDISDERITYVVNNIRTHYSNSHIFLCKNGQYDKKYFIPLANQVFDLTIEVQDSGCVVTRPKGISRNATNFLNKVSEI